MQREEAAAAEEEAALRAAGFALAQELAPHGVQLRMLTIKGFIRPGGRFDPDRIAVSGSSAGGAMAAWLCLMAHDRGNYKIAFQHLEAPRLDDRLAAPEDANAFTGEFVWTRENSAYCRQAYLGKNTSDPYGSAARATSLSGLPPAYIAVGSLDLFVDECLAYTSRLGRSGVPVELIIYPGCFHGFKMAASASVTKRAEDDNIRALRKALT